MVPPFSLGGDAMGKIDERTAIRMRFDERHSYRVIGERFGATKQAVAAFFDRRGHAGRVDLADRKRRCDRIDVDAARRLLDGDGLSCVAEVLDVSVGGLRRALKRG